MSWKNYKRMVEAYDWHLILNKRDPARQGLFWAGFIRSYGKELLIALYVCPSLGPSNRTTATTTTATNERIIAYSTSP